MWNAPEAPKPSISWAVRFHSTVTLLLEAGSSIAAPDIVCTGTGRPACCEFAGDAINIAATVQNTILKKVLVLMVILVSGLKVFGCLKVINEEISVEDILYLFNKDSSGNLIMSSFKFQN